MLVVSSPCALSATEVLLRSGSSIAAALDFFSNSIYAEMNKSKMHNISGQ